MTLKRLLSWFRPMASVKATASLLPIESKHPVNLQYQESRISLWPQTRKRHRSQKPERTCLQTEKIDYLREPHYRFTAPGDTGAEHAPRGVSFIVAMSRNRLTLFAFCTLKVFENQTVIL